jgi:hypothetical protein
VAVLAARILLAAAQSEVAGLKMPPVIVTKPLWLIRSRSTV